MNNTRRMKKRQALKELFENPLHICEKETALATQAQKVEQAKLQRLENNAKVTVCVEEGVKQLDIEMPMLRPILLQFAQNINFGLGVPEMPLSVLGNLHNDTSFHERIPAPENSACLSGPQQLSDTVATLRSKDHAWIPFKMLRPTHTLGRSVGKRAVFSPSATLATRTAIAAYFMA